MMFHIGSGPSSGSGGFMEHSSSPNGPWVTATTKPSGCNNPAPAFHPNGTLFVVCNHFSITSATAVDAGGPIWNAPYTPLVPIGHPRSSGMQDETRHWEDPTLWFDKRGNWHIIYHVYCLLPFTAHHECASGHGRQRRRQLNAPPAATQPASSSSPFAQPESRRA